MDKGHKIVPKMYVELRLFKTVKMLNEILCQWFVE